MQDFRENILILIFSKRRIVLFKKNVFRHNWYLDCDVQYKIYLLQKRKTIHTLLGTISEPAGFVWTARSASSVNPGQLSELPAANPDEEAHDVALLLSVDFLHVLVGPHGERLPGTRRAEKMNRELT